MFLHCSVSGVIVVMYLYGISLSATTRSETDLNTLFCLFICFFVCFLDPRTLFYPHRNIVSGTVAFQSVCYPEWYLIFHNKTEVKLGVPHRGNELFEETVLYSGYAYKSYVYNDPHCYLAFDDVGNVHDQHLCRVTTQHRDVRIFPMEALQSSSCHRSTVEL